MIYRSILLPAVFALSACGGSQTAPTIEPIASAGFASAEALAAPQTKLTLPETVRILRDSEGNNAQFARQQVVISLDDDDFSSFALELDGVTYALTQNTEDLSEYTFDAGNTFILFNARQNRNSVVAAELFAEFPGNDTELNAAHIVYGFDTDPDEVSARSGNASYSGAMEAALRSENYDDAYGVGTFTLDVDFDEMVISGNGLIPSYDLVDPEIPFDVLEIEFARTAITGNGFAGEVEISPVGFGAQTEGAQNGYEGRFYAEDALSIGGQFYGTLDLERQDGPTLVEGFFIGSDSE